MWQKMGCGKISVQYTQNTIDATLLVLFCHFNPLFFVFFKKYQNLSKKYYMFKKNLNTFAN